MLTKQVVWEHPELWKIDTIFTLICYDTVGSQKDKINAKYRYCISEYEPVDLAVHCNHFSGAELFSGTFC